MKVAIVHTSPAMAGALAQFVRSVPGWAVVWTAATGADAIDRCAAGPPDALLANAVLADMDGAALTRRLAGAATCPVVLLTDGTDAHSAIAFGAMAAGAAGVVPGLAIGTDGRLAGGDEIVRRLRVAARLGPGTTTTLRDGAAASRTVPERPDASPGRASAQHPPLVVLGASTGGPAALAAVLGGLTAPCRAAIVVVQHVGEEFSRDMTRWLEGKVHLPVRGAQRGAAPTAGTILLASGDEDLVVTTTGALDYRSPAPGSFYHPSVDVFYRSLAEHWTAPGLAVLLTGIGRDGAEGLLALRARGWQTIAQDEASSVVYGMPKAAVELQAAIQVLSLDHIGLAVARFAGQVG
jgi:chemotaxis response regulator CheB